MARGFLSEDRLERRGRAAAERFNSEDRPMPVDVHARYAAEGIVVSGRARTSGEGE